LTQHRTTGILTRSVLIIIFFWNHCCSKGLLNSVASMEIICFHWFSLLH
jgi:hypothetical protein